MCLLGEAWGEKEEARQGTPFVGPAGFRLERMVQQLGSARADFLLTNVCWARPPSNRAPTEGEIEHWRPQWEHAIGEAGVKVVVPLGNSALWAVTEQSGIQDRRGYLRWSDRLRCWVLPTVHPSFIMRGNANWTAAWLRDVGMALQVAQAGPPAPPHRTMTLDPSPDAVATWGQRWALAGHPPLAFDIETPYEKDDDEGLQDVSSTIYRIGLAYRHTNTTHTISLPWGGSFVAVVSGMLRDAPVAVVWNRHFDVPRLRAHQVAFVTVHDVQEMWHVFHTDLPKKLVFAVPFLVPAQPYWKDQAGARPAYYNAVDAAVTVEAFAVLWGEGLQGGVALPRTPDVPPVDHTTDDDIPF